MRYSMNEPRDSFRKVSKPKVERMERGKSLLDKEPVVDPIEGLRRSMEAMNRAIKETKAIGS